MARTAATHIVLENRKEDTWDFAVYRKETVEIGEGEEVKTVTRFGRHILFVARLGRASDRDKTFQQVPTVDNQNPQPKPLPPGRAHYDQGNIGEVGEIHSPVLKLTPDEYAAILESQSGDWLRGRLEAGTIMKREEQGALPKLDIAPRRRETPVLA